MAATLLGVMLLLMLGSVWNDSATTDELAHIPAGFGYITQRDYRLNPEHPPLIKAISALSAQIFVRPHFPTNTPYWQDDTNGQWAQGAKFLYESGNDADRILFWSRLPLILLTVFFGWLLFWWTRNKFGATPALLTLTLFVFSPTFLAHSRYVTTDLGAALGFFAALASFLAFLEKPSWRQVLLAGIIFGLAQLTKFSLVLLIPIFLILLLTHVGVVPYINWYGRFKKFLALAGKTLIIFVIGLLLIWGVYGYFVSGYPQERQLDDADFLLDSYGFRPAVNLNLALIKNQWTRPLGEYLLGFLMVQQRSAGGNTAFFLGEVSATGSRLYFPFLYFLKESLALHILTLIAVVFGLRKLGHTKDISPASPFKEIHSYSLSEPELNSTESKDNLLNAKFYPSTSSANKILTLIRLWIHNHFIEFTSLLFIAFYWAISIASPLNIGVRHILPTFPFIYLLVARHITEWVRPRVAPNPATWWEWLMTLYQIHFKAMGRYFILTVLLLWLALNTLSAFPHFLSYYNKLAGDTSSGYRFAVDSNYDWGQDLKRLTDFVDERGIEKIAVDYFGGGNPRYYLGEKFEPWWSARGPASGWFAISATFRQGAFGAPVQGFTRKTDDSYEWLKQYEPVARAGQSIFVYKLP